RAAWTADAEPGYFFSGVAFSPDGRFAAAGQEVLAQGFNTPDVGVRLILWEWEADREIAQPIAHQGAVNAVQFSPDGHWLASGGDDGIAKLWEWNDSERTLRDHRSLRGHTGAIQGVAFEPDPDGTRLATASEDRTLKIWDWRSGRERLTLRG